MTNNQHENNNEQELEKTKINNAVLIKKPRMRSPSYPIYDIDQSLDYVKRLMDAYGTQFVPFNILHTPWKFKESSGHIAQLLATLNSYGLIDTEGHQDKRKIRPSEQAKRIIRNAPDKRILLKQCVLQPKVFKAIWDKYKKDDHLPAEEILDHELQWGEELGFQFENERARRTVIKNFLYNAKVANLKADDKLSATTPEGDNMDSENRADNQDEQQSKMTPPAEKHLDYFILNSKVGSLKLRYPMTKEKLEVIEKYIQAEKAESELIENDETAKDSIHS